MLIVLVMFSTFLGSVVALEYVMSADQSWLESVRSVAQAAWPWLRAAGLWGLAAGGLVTLVLMLMIRQIPKDHEP